jgi:membrane complex biogenesis BtpA family protein
MFTRSLIGMVHVGALPGTPRSKRAVLEIAQHAAAEARLLRDCGFDGVLVENMHDVPYVNAPHDPVITAAMTRCVLAVREAVGEGVHLGVQILSRGEREALAVAHAAGASFIRCESFVFAHVADEGLLAEAAAGPLLRYRRGIGAEHIRVFADVQKKHASHAITADLSLADLVHGSAFFGADGVIVTGAATGQPTDLADVQAARAATTLPILVGSGVTPTSAPALLRHADALIVGTAIKVGGVWSGPVDRDRCEALVRAARA